MAKFPYIQNRASLRRFLESIPERGVPPKVDATYLLSVGVLSGSLSRMPSVLESLGFIDPSGVPTERWKAYRDSSQARTELASGIRGAYSEVFETYADAYLKDDETLANFFSSTTSLAKSTVKDIVRTFKALCQLADFAPAEGAEPFPEAPVTIVVEAEPTKKASERELQPVVRGRQGLTINVNIQLTLPSDIEDHNLYDRFFASLKKHLLT